MSEIYFESLFQNKTNNIFKNKLKKQILYFFIIKNVKNKRSNNLLKLV
jgi:hypothetical protein